MIDDLLTKRSFGSISLVVTSSTGGYSEGSFSSFNLADYVGDDPVAVSRNQEKLAQLLVASELKILRANHGSAVQVVGPDSEVLPGDGLVTTYANLGLVALSADCATFGLIDPVSNVLAVGHCGWKGLVNQLPNSVISRFQNQGGVPSRSLAVIGPTICAKCYQVSQERVQQVKQVCPSAVHCESNLDIARGIQTTIEESGFQVEVIAQCTFESHNLYSYRRHQNTGRHALALIRHESED